jgi:hypothetical protein
MTLGPWYVGDSPTSDIVVSLARDGEVAELDGYASAAVLLYNPAGAPITWGTTPTIDPVEDTATIPPPSSSPFATAGEYQLYLRLTTAAARVETVMVDRIEILAVGTRPTLAQIKDYLKDAATGWSDPQIQAALDVEAAAQARTCRIGATFPPDLAEALKRRVRRNLTMRGIPLGVQTSEVGPIRVGRDPEIRRLEAPFLKLPVG